jgi:class 3 adenylate cyclase
MALDRSEAERRGLLKGAITVEDRMALLELLAAEGITVDEMVEAHRHGGLLRIAGERVVRPGAGALTLLDVAERTGIEVELVQRILRAVGDAVLWTCTDIDAHLEIARSIVEPLESDGHALSARAGLAYGWILAREGDYFGPTVNLAARLVDLTPPSRVTVAEGLGALVDRSRWSLEPQLPARVRGIDEPVNTFLLAL